MAVERRLRLYRSDGCCASPGCRCGGSVPDCFPFPLAALLEPRHHLPQMHRQLFVHEQDAMQVVGHDLHGHDLNLGIVAGDALPFGLHGLSQGRQLHVCCPGATSLGIGIPCHSPEQRAAAFYLHRDHVHAAPTVVVVVVAPLHGGFRLACVALCGSDLLLGLHLFRILFLAAKIARIVENGKRRDGK